MADFQSEWKFNVDTSDAISAIKNLQRQISAFHQAMQQSGNAANAATSANMQRNLLNNINATGKFAATMTSVKTETEAFTNALEKNKLSMGQYFRYAGASTKTFGRLFSSEFSTIERVATERVKTLQTQYIKMGKDANGAMQAIAVKPLALDMNNLGTQVMMTAQKQQIFNELLKQGSTNLLNFGKNTQWAGRQLMVGFTIPLSIMGAAAVREFQKIEEQAVKFKRVYGDLFTTGEETERALKDIKKLADEFTKYGIAIEETIGLAASVAQMGNVGADLTNQVTQATRLAVLGGMEQQKSLDTTISLTNAFGIATEDLADKINFLNAAENQTILAIEDFTEAVPKAGSVVSQLGGSVEDLAFFLTAMREGGVNASQGANALKSSLARLINPTERAREDLAAFGIDVTGIVERNVGNLRGTVMELAYALDGLEPLARSRALEELFGKFQFARMSTLFQNVIKEGSQAQTILKLTQQTSAELQVLANRELKRVEESPAFKLQKQLEKLQAALAPIGEEFIKLIMPLLEFANKVLKSFNEMDQGAKSFVTGLVAVLGGLAPVALMTFGLIANGVANVLKGFNVYRSFLGRLAGVNQSVYTSTQYMTNEHLRATSVAMSLAQSHQFLTTQYTSETTAIQGLIAAYQQATAAQRAFNQVAVSAPARPIISRVGPRRVRATQGTPPSSQASGGPIGAYARGILSIPGPRGAGDIVPAMLAPGESVIPAKQTEKYGGFIKSIINDEVPGFVKGRLGMPLPSKAVSKNRTAAEAIYQNLLKTKYANVTPTEYGHQLSKTTGHSFPIFGLGGVYATASGKKVFVKPVMDEKAALAEMRGTQIARQAHDLQAPKQRIVVIRDPLDTSRKRKFLALESDLDPKFIRSDDKSLFNEEQYFRQLVASLVRVDKDLAADNLFGDVVADVGPAGVFSRASGQRDYTTQLPSMEQQATINLLGVKGGAKRAFAESTVGLMPGMTAEQYHQNMIAEIGRVAPKLRQTVASFGLTNPSEVDAYNAMIKRLEDGRNVDWRKFHAMHSAVRPTAKKTQAMQPIPQFADGVFNLAGPRGAGDIIPAMIAPGESVISANMTQKYGPLVRGIIADNLPGFKNSLDGTSLKQDYLQKPAQRRRRSISSSYEMLESSSAGSGERILDTLSNAGVSVENARKLTSQAADEAAKGTEALARFMQVLEQSISEATKRVDGFVKNSKALVDTVRQETGFDPGGQGKAFTHIGGGTNVSAGELQQMAASGELKTYDEAERKALMALDPNSQVGVKSGLGMGNFDQEINRRLDSTGAKIEDFAGAFDEAGVEKWNDSVKFGGGKISELGTQTQILDNELRRLISTVSAGTTVFDRAEQAQEFTQRTGQPATSVESLYGQARSNVKGQAPELVKALDKAAATPTELRGVAGISPGSKRRAIAKPLEGLKKQALSEGIGGPVEQAIDQSIDSAMTRAKRELEIKSPSERASRELGLPIAQGIADGVKDGKPVIDQAISSTVTRSVADGTKRIRRASSEGINFNAKFAGSRPPEIPTPTAATGGISPSLAQKMGLPELQSQIAETIVPPEKAIGKGLKGKLAKIGQGILNKTEDSLMHGILGKTKRGGMLRDTMVANALTDAQVASKGAAVELTDRNGNVIAAEPGKLAEDIAVDADGNPIVDANGNPISKSEAKKLAAKQGRRERAGRVGGILAGASMASSMASMAPGQVGEMAQKIMPALFALSMVAPALLAMNPAVAALAVVVGAVAFGLYKYNEELNKTREEHRKLGLAMSAGADNMQRFAEAAGTVTPGEVMDIERAGIGQQVQRAAGKNPFGITFFDSDSGAQMLEEFELTVSKFGKSSAVDSLKHQLATAVSSGILSVQQAGSIALELGNKINDYGVTIEIAAELNELFGPNGEKLLSGDPLQIAVDIAERSVNNFTRNISEAAEALSGGGWLREFLGLDDEAIAAFAGGALQGFVEEQQNALDTLDAGANKRIENLQAEAAALKAQGKDATEVFKKIEKERESLYRNRQELLDDYQVNFETAIFAVENMALPQEQLDAFRQRAEEIVNTEMGNEYQPYADPNAPSRQERIEEEYNRLLADEAPENALAEKIYAGFVTGIKKGLEDLPDDVRKVAEGAIDKISDMELDLKAKVLLTSGIASGDLDIETIGRLFQQLELTGAGSNQFYFEIIGDVILRGGARATSQINAILGAIGGLYTEDSDAANATASLLEDLRGLEGIDLTRTLDQLTFFSTFISLFDGVDPISTFLRLSEEEKADMFERMDMMQALVDSVPSGEKLKVEQVIEQKILTDQAMLGAFKEDAEFFEKLDPVQQFLYIQRFIAISEIVDDTAATSRLATQGVKPGEVAGFDPRTGQIAYSGYSRKQIEEAKRDIVKETLGIEDLLSSLGEPEVTPQGGGTKQDPFENILNSLQRLRNWTIDAKGGMDELLRVLGDGQKMTVFRGTEQLGMLAEFGKDFSGYLSGLDEDTRKLFVQFTKAGPVLTETGRAMQKAFLETGIGEFQLNIVQSMEALKNKRETIEILTDRGLDYADAMRIATDETMALAIASGKIDSIELAKIVKEVQALRAQEAVDSVLDQISEEIDDFIKDMSAKESIKLNYNPLEQSAILNDSTLMAMAKLGQYGAEEFATRLAQVMGTIEFKQSIFEEGFSKAMESFTALEEQITLDFELGLNLSGANADLVNLTNLRSALADAENEVAKINFELDDLDAELENISEQEESINEKYDERLEALDKISSLNDAIARQQKSQLTIADALSRGDIAAAARAADEARAAQAKEAIENNKKLIEQQREQELGALTSAQGSTREQLETRIKDLKSQIFAIEEATIEPLSEQIRLAEYAIQVAVSELTVLDRTRAQWEQIKNTIDVARVSSEQYAQAMQAALDIVDEIISYWNGIESKTVYLNIVERKTTEGETITPTSVEEPPAPPRINSSYTVVAEAQAEGNERAAVIDRDVAAAAAKEAVHGAGVSAGDTTIKASSTLDFAEQVKAKVLENRAKVLDRENPPSPAEKKRLMQENIQLMQTSGLRFNVGGMVPKRYAMGGKVGYYPMGGMIPYKANGGLFKSINTDTVPAMLTPGEFVVRRFAVEKFGAENLKAINNGTYNGESVYNYSVNVNVRSDANPDDIARTVMTQIKQIDAQRVRGNRF